MKRELKSYLAGWLALYLAAVCLPFLLAGCASDGAAPWPVDGETTSVTLRMSVAGAVGTRADGTEDERHAGKPDKYPARTGGDGR